MASTSVSKPQTAYWMWLNDNRSKIASTVGNNVTLVAKKGGEMWKALSAAEKEPYEKKAKEQKDAYDKFIATEEGQKALADKKAAKADEKAEKLQKEQAKADKTAAKEERKQAIACKAAVKALAAEKDDALKKPVSAYWLWLNENRQLIVEKAGTSKGSDVSKKGGEMWKVLTDAEKQPWENKAKEQKDAYEKYIASPEGAAKLKAFNEATQAAKDKFKTPEKEKEEGRKEDDEKKEEGKKRKPEPIKSKVSPAKKAKTAKAQDAKPAIELPKNVQDKADAHGYTDVLTKLLDRDDIKAQKVSASKALEALQKSNGLLHPARRALLGA